MTTLAEKRRAIRPLLGQNNPYDARASYYAFHHPDEKVELVLSLGEGKRARGYVCLARTGIDLFRPLVTLRLPTVKGGSEPDPAGSVELIYQAVPEGMGVILSCPAAYRPILGALFDVLVEERLRILLLDRRRFEPVINVFVTRSETYKSLPRYVIRQTSDGRVGTVGDIVASAGLNWQSPQFAEIYVHTKHSHRRQGLGRSVVASIVQHVLDSGRLPIYAAGAGNEASIQLAESVGFVDTGMVDLLLEGVLKPQP